MQEPQHLGIQACSPYGQVTVRSQLLLWMELLSHGKCQILSNALGASDLTDLLDFRPSQKESVPFLKQGIWFVYGLLSRQPASPRGWIGAELSVPCTGSKAPRDHPPSYTTPTVPV